MPSGHRDAAAARISGGASKDRDFEVPSGWSPSGPPAADAQRKADAENRQRIPSSRTIARMMTFGRNNLSKAETVTITAIETGVPGLVEARERIAEFQAMVRNKTDADLATWIAEARASLFASFAGGVAKDKPAVRAAITLPWSNGQTEGQITKLKLVKRQMYGRAKIDLLQARLIGAPA
jgi:transposase